MRIVLVATLLVCLGTPAGAQERQFGFKAGPTVSSLPLEPEETDGFGRRTGASGGVFAVLPLSPRFALQLEGIYAQKGGKLDVPDFPDTASILLGYVEFPVLLRVEGPRIGRSALHVFAGPAVGFRATARRQFSSSGGFGSSGVSVDMADEIRFLEGSAVVGAGIEPHPRIVIDGRYSWGLTHVNKDTEGDFYVRTRALTFLLGVRFAR